MSGARQVLRECRSVTERRDGEHVTAILEELKRAEAKCPTWPDDVMHGIGIVAEESGEAVKAALHYCYDGADIVELRLELIQTAAMALSMLEYLECCPKHVPR